MKLNKNNFDEALKSDKPVLVDFWAQWCGPCRMVSPIIEELEGEFGDSAVIGKVNVDEEAELALRYNVVSIPTVMIFKNGEQVEKIVGASSYDEYAEALDKYIIQ